MSYIHHLSKDKKLKKIIDRQDPQKLVKRKNIGSWIIASIISQQLSTRVADVIYQRYLDLYNGKDPDPRQILDTPPEKLRSAGLSRGKASYVQNVARFEIKEGLDPKKLNRMSNEEVISYLTQIKGVGRWTVEMLLMFALGREDVFAVDDTGIQNAMIRLYGLDNSDKKEFRKQLLLISDRWSPYRTYACLHLWKWRDNTPK